LGERAERDRVCEGFRKCLQSRDVRSEGELAIADGERRLDIEPIENRYVPGDNGAPVNRGLRSVSAYRE
jgi:hypothetical protein